MANKLYGAIETAVTFTDSGGDVAFTLANLAAGSGRVSAQRDKGTGSRAVLHKVRAIFQFESAPAEGETVDVYIAEGDGVNVDGNLGAADAAVADADTLKYLKFIGSVTAESAAAATVFEASFAVNIYERHYSVVAWNSSAASNLAATAGVNKVIVTPVPPELQ